MADGVSDGCFVAVMVDEGVMTTAGEVSVKVETSVVGMEEGVDVMSGGVMGFWVETRANRIRRIIAMMPGITYFR